MKVTARSFSATSLIPTSCPANYNAPLAEGLKTLNEWRERYGTRR
jgi:hypothetical protein